jgi:hypothetical protein
LFSQPLQTLARSRKKDPVADQHASHASVLHSGADYLDNLAAEMEREAATMDEEAQQTSIPQVREGYERFAEALRHCAQTLQNKSRELRGN